MKEERPILATNIDGLLIKHKAFTEPHKIWFDNAAKKIGDKSILKYKAKKNYFIGVNKAMDKLMPNASRADKTLQARIWHQEDLINYIQDHPECVNRHIAGRLKQLKVRYKLVLVTSNTERYIERILTAAGLTKLYDAIISSDVEQEPDKSELIEDLISEQGKPKYFLSGKKDEDLAKILKKKEIKLIFVKDIDSI